MIRNAWSSSTWSPFAEMQRVQDEVNRLFGVAPDGWNDGSPRVNVATSEDGARLFLQLPGYRVEDLELSLEGAKLSVRGKRASIASAETDVWHAREFGDAEFERQFELPFRVQADEVSASFENGVLEIYLPRLAEERARRITVKTRAES